MVEAPLHRGRAGTPLPARGVSRLGCSACGAKRLECVRFTGAFRPVHTPHLRGAHAPSPVGSSGSMDIHVAGEAPATAPGAGALPSPPEAFRDLAAQPAARSVWSASGSPALFVQVGRAGTPLPAARWGDGGARLRRAADHARINPVTPFSVSRLGQVVRDVSTSLPDCQRMGASSTRRRGVYGEGLGLDNRLVSREEAQILKERDAALRLTLWHRGGCPPLGRFDVVRSGQLCFRDRPARPEPPIHTLRPALRCNRNSHPSAATGPSI